MDCIHEDALYFYECNKNGQTSKNEIGSRSGKSDKSYGEP